MRFSTRMMLSSMNDTFGIRTKRETLSGFNAKLVCDPQGCRASRSNPGLGLANAFGVRRGIEGFCAASTKEDSVVLAG